MPMAKLPDPIRVPSGGRSKVTLYLASGACVDTWVNNTDFVDDPDLAEETGIDAEDIRDHISDPPRPHWSIIGDVCVFTQAISAVEVG